MMEVLEVHQRRVGMLDLFKGRVGMLDLFKRRVRRLIKGVEMEKVLQETWKKRAEVEEVGYVLQETPNNFRLIQT